MNKAINILIAFQKSKIILNKKNIEVGNEFVEGELAGISKCITKLTQAKEELDEDKVFILRKDTEGSLEKAINNLIREHNLDVRKLNIKYQVVDATGYSKSYSALIINKG